jgi:8-oxo-dGTP pyrophosphatase MutT (NUDIX family)
MTAFDLAAIRARLAAITPNLVEGDMPRAAVLIPLCTKASAPAVLFTKRTETVGTHKGQVSFPGGRMDPEDKDVVDTALREVHEELGIPREKVDVLGRFHEVVSITGMGVTPIVAFLADTAHLTPSPAEIDDVFVLSLDELTQSREVRPLRSGRPGPWYMAGPHPVWGLTAFILEEFLREILDVKIAPLVLE